MGRWWLALGGLLVWTAHFLGVYLIASLRRLNGDGGRWLWLAAGFGFACLLAAAGVGLAAARRWRRGDPTDTAARMLDQVGVIGAGLAMVAVAWQTAASLIVD